MLRRSLIVLLAIAGLSAAGSGSPLIDAVKAGSRDTVRALVSQSADVNARDADGTTALHWAVRDDDLETVHLLLRAGAKADVVTRNRVTPLSLAAINGSAAMIETLLQAGADPNITLSQGQTALMMAARTGKPDAVKALLTHGAGIHVREELFGETALTWAAAEDHAETIALLVARGASVDIRSNLMKYPREEFGDGKSGRLTVLPKGGWTPLMYAARQNAMHAVRALADAGANLNLTDPDKTSALLIATINAHYDLAALLLEKGANPNIGDVTG